MQRYYEFHRRQHPAALGASHVFLYREVLGRDLPWLAGIVRAKTPVRLPVVLGRNEVQGTVQELLGHRDLTTTMIYTHVQVRTAKQVTSPLDGRARRPGLPLRRPVAGRD